MRRRYSLTVQNATRSTLGGGSCGKFFRTYPPYSLPDSQGRSSAVFQWVQGALTARTTSARGSVMTPVQWVIAMLAAGLTGVSYRGSHDWVLVFFAILLGGAILFFTVVYCVDEDRPGCSPF